MSKKNTISRGQRKLLKLQLKEKMKTRRRNEEQRRQNYFR